MHFDDCRNQKLAARSHFRAGQLFVDIQFKSFMKLSFAIREHLALWSVAQIPAAAVDKSRRDFCF